MTPPNTSNLEFHYFHVEVEYVLKCAVNVKSTTGSDPSDYYSCIYFVETLLNVLETSFISEMTILSNSMYL